MFLSLLILLWLVLLIIKLLHFSMRLTKIKMGISFPIWVDGPHEIYTWNVYRQYTEGSETRE